MRVVTAIDSFKGSMTSIEAGNAVAAGFRLADPSVEVVVRPLADGGEGTVTALAEGLGGDLVTVEVTGPFGKPVNCEYCVISDRKLAVIEMSGAAGITLQPKSELNPMKATTYGVGEVIRDALQRGCREFIVGIGGSATNDGGAGMLQALGFGLLDANGEQIRCGAEGLADLVKVSCEDLPEELRECVFHVACDVTNPLCGETGSSAVFGPQKGASPEMVKELDQLLAGYADVTRKTFTEADPDMQGAGAAGGLGFAFASYLGAELKPGIQLVLDETALAKYLKDADLVVTGEGMLDFQTSMGKAPVGVAQLAKQFGKPVIAFAGGVTPDARACNEKGIDAYFPIVRGITTLDEAMVPANAIANLTAAAEQAMRMWMAARM